MELYEKTYIVKNEKKRLFIIHGICEHSGRYENLAKKFNEQGISVIMYDLRGHGKSPGRRGYIKNYYDHINDFANIFKKHSNNKVKQFLLGHSLGGLIGHMYMVSNNPGIDGYIASGAPTDYLKSARLMRFIGYKWFGFLRIKNNFGENALSKDKEVQEQYNNDPLVQKNFTIRLAGEMFIKGVRYLNNNLDNHSKPILILHGKEDKIVPYEHSERIYKNINHDNKKLIIYENMYHEILNEVEKEIVFKDIMEWLNER